MSLAPAILKPEQFLPQVLEVYSALKIRIQAKLSYAEVEHVGSSAIQGAFSKGDLDILVRVGRVEMPKTIADIESLGFRIKEDTLRTESLCMLETANYAPLDVAVQVIERGSEFEAFVEFRNRLNADSELVEQYNQLKIAATGETHEEYRERKAKFIESVLKS